MLMGASLGCCVVIKENVRPDFEFLLCYFLCVLEQVMKSLYVLMASSIK